jgi:Tfp pilus assembly protein PilN
VLLADESLYNALVRQFAGAGWSIAPRTDNAPDSAARHAAGAQLRLATSAMVALRRARERTTAVRLAVAAVVLVIAAAVVEMWGANRELDAVRGRRAEIRSQVSPLLAMRDSIDRLDTQAADVESAGRASPRWTAALFDLALLLPPETWLTRLYATGDTLIVDAQGERAGAALQALRGSGALSDARLVGVVDRELADGATSSERFRIRARVEAP